MRNNTPNLFHGYFKKYSDTHKEPLWRWEDNMTILIMTEEKPEFDDFVEDFGYNTYETKSLDGLFGTIKEGSIYKFKTKMCVIRKNNGKEYPIRDDKSRYEYLVEKASQNGCYIDDAWILDEQHMVFKHGNNNERIKLHPITFEGILTVTDPEKFKQMLIKGFGKKRTFGLGLFTIIPLGI